MNDFKSTNEYPQESYQTGSTQPPKSYGGIIAILLILVIFLSGIVTILSMMNVHLFRMVKSQDSICETIFRIVVLRLCWQGVILHRRKF